MQHKYFFKLLQSIPHTTKKELVLQFSNGKTSSLNELQELYPSAYSSMISAMVALQPTDSPADLKRYRSAILHRLQKHGVDTTNWANVNHFLAQPQVAGKRLYEMSVKEMIDLIPKLESILKKDSAIKNHIKHISNLN